MIRVIVADDHHLVRQGIRALLEKAGDIEVIGEAQDGQEAVELVKHLAPDVLVTDLSMPRLNGVDSIQQVCGLSHTTKVIVLSMYSDQSLVRRALRSGAKGYVLKSSVTDELLLAVHAAGRGEIYLSPAVSTSLVQDLFSPHGSSGQADPVDQLSARERQALQLIAEGHTNNQVAELMGISVKTVEKHRASLMAKLNVHDTAGLVRIAIKYRLIFIEE